MSELQWIAKTGKEIAEFKQALAQLRIEVFREYPYLYDGDFDYENKYLQVYEKNQRGFLVGLQNGSKWVGAATALPLKGEDPAFYAPFEAFGLKANEIFYFGESVLLRPFRGLGYGKKFFEKRLEFVRQFKEYTAAAFCAVVRPENDPRRPKEYSSPEPIWRKFGFKPLQGLTLEFSWKEMGEAAERPHRLQVWFKSLQDGI